MSNLRVPMKGGVAYCCHISDFGQHCPNPAKYGLYPPVRSWDDYTHACEEHLEEMKCDGDAVEPLDS